jgi:uncharacterized membrane protein YhiD involved in acid resistance
MPPESLWNQYSVVGILILAAGVIAIAFYRLWHELLTWIENQDLKREQERETQDLKREQERDKQRAWEAQQKKESDERWQLFLSKQQEQWLTQDLSHSAAIVKVIEKIEHLTNSVNNHDTWARAQNGK